MPKKCGHPCSRCFKRRGRLHHVTMLHLLSVLRYIYTLYVMSDSYLGLDQQYDLHLNVTPASIAAQVNTEVLD